MAVRIGRFYMLLLQDAVAVVFENRELVWVVMGCLAFVAVVILWAWTKPKDVE